MINSYQNNPEESHAKELNTNGARTSDPELIRQARALTADVYLKRSFITPNQIDEDGGISKEIDPHADHSQYYVVQNDNGEAAATLRTIHHDLSKGIASFPMLEHASSLNPEDMARLNDIGYENVVEVSALVRDKILDKDKTAALKLYRQLFQDAWKNDKESKLTFVMACNPVLYETFRMLFDGAMERIGPDLPYPGQEAIPTMFINSKGANHLIDISNDKKNPYRGLHKTVAEYFLTGVGPGELSEDVEANLKEKGFDNLLCKIRSNEWGDIEERDKKMLRRLKLSGALGRMREKSSKYRPEIIAAGGLIGYTIGRTALVGAAVSPVSDVSWEAFLAIELATTPQYVWGVGDMARGAGKDMTEYPKRRKLGAFAAASSAFAAPYVYLGAEGALSSTQGAYGVGGLVALLAVAPAAKKIKKYRKSKKEPSQEDIPV